MEQIGLLECFWKVKAKDTVCSTRGFPAEFTRWTRLLFSYNKDKRTANRRAVGDQIVDERRSGELFVLILFAFKLTAEVP